MARMMVSQQPRNLCVVRRPCMSAHAKYAPITPPPSMISSFTSVPLGLPHLSPTTTDHEWMQLIPCTRRKKLAQSVKNIAATLHLNICCLMLALRQEQADECFFSSWFYFARFFIFTCIMLLFITPKK